VGALVVIGQGEVWWNESESTKGRPVLVLSRNGAIPVMETVLVAPITRTIRGLPSEVGLERSEGVLTTCVASFDNTQVIAKSTLTRRLGALSDGRWHEVCAAMKATIDC
jgi:mRNA interferase MazF